MLNFVFISPNFPPTYYLFCSHLRRQGANVLAIGEEEYHRLGPELREAVTEYYYVPSLGNYDSILRAVGFFTYKYGKIHRIESHNEFWLETEAQLREDFNVVGPWPQDMPYIKRKSEMKKIYLQAGVKVARGALIKSKEEAIKFCEEVGYPVVAKPDIGVGAGLTYKIESAEDFQQVDFSIDYFVEEFITGKIVTFDGLADRNGKIVFFASHEYSTGVMEVANDNVHVYYYSHRVIPEDLQINGAKVVEAFKVKERFFHIEFFRQADGALVGLEMNLRPPGGFTVDMFNYANDIDLYSGYAQVVCHPNLFQLEYHRPYHCCYVSRKNHYDYKHTHEEVLAFLSSSLVFQTKLPPGLKLMGDQCYIIRMKTLEQMDQAISFIWALKETKNPDLTAAVDSTTITPPQKESTLLS